MTNLAVVIPVYQHGKELVNTIVQLEGFGVPVIVINDGSNATETEIIRKACVKKFVYLFEREQNGGKGQAVIDGLVLAEKKGFSHVFQIDADGQHDLSEIPRFIKASEFNSSSLILGYPCFDNSVPSSRKIGRWVTHIWVWINSMSFRVRDSMCGFRIYPVRPVLDIIRESKIGYHMEFDVELCIRSCWKNLPVINLPVKVVYPVAGRSNFRLKEDNVLLIQMHTKLFFGMLLRSPYLLVERLRGFFVRK